MTKYNHEAGMTHEAVGITEEEFYTISKKVMNEELRSIVSQESKISEIAEAIETWLANGTDMEKAIKYIHIARAVSDTGMV